jgi:hypothetical protein
MTAAPATTRRPSRRDLALDLALAVGLTLLVAYFVSATQPFFALRGGPIPVPERGRPGFLGHGATLLSYALVVLSFMPLALRRLYPAAVLAVVTAAG